MASSRRKQNKKSRKRDDKKQAPGYFSTQRIEKLPAFAITEQYGQLLTKSLQRHMDQMKQVDPTTGGAIAMDAAVKQAFDNNIQQVKSFTSQGGSGLLPIHQIDWYSSQGFIGWQICAIIGQQWLVNKALKMPGLDAVRHGFDRSVNDTVTVNAEVFDKLRKLDKKYKLKQNLVEHYKYARMFGLRHTMFIIDGMDYEAPFNADGIKPGTYKGMTQIDPYWLAPEFDFKDASDPASPNFYNPTYWRVNGKRVHRSHFVISRNGNDLADILKPSYFYGGIPTTQLILERVYAAERVANEAPLLAMSKRLFSLKVDTSKAITDLNMFKQEIQQWTELMNNFGVKVIGGDEEVQQFDTNLSSLDETIMTQYQLVAAAAEIPATKLLGTSPKGFNATGDYETDSYHEFLESIQEDELSPIVERHTLCCQRSELIAAGVNFEVQWKPVDTPNAKEAAEINKIKADTDAVLNSSGAIDGYDMRQRIAKDPDSGYDGIPEIVPDGPGDREAELEDKEQEKDLAVAKVNGNNNEE